MSKQFFQVALCAAMLCCGCARHRAQITSMLPTLPPIPSLPAMPAIPSSLRISRSHADVKNEAVQVGVESVEPTIFRDHEFETDAARLNVAGEDHVRQMAELGEGDWTIVIEPPFSLAEPETPGASDQLSKMRRQIVVQKLLSLGIVDAEKRVVVRSDFVQPLTPRISDIAPVHAEMSPLE